MSDKIVCTGCLKSRNLCDFVAAGRYVRSVDGMVFRDRPHSKSDLIVCRDCEKSENVASFALRSYKRIKTRHKQLTGDLLPYSFGDFWFWLQTTRYERLYNKYRKTGYPENCPITPSIDRIDAWRGYDLNNIQVLTVSENSSKGDKLALGGREKTMLFFKTLRKSLNMTKYEMARHLDMLPQTYYYYEDKARGCSFEILSLLRKKLNISWEDLGALIDQDVKRDAKDKKVNKKENVD